MYDDGDGVKQNQMKAVEWYKKSAEQGCSQAQDILGLKYLVGDYVPQNKDKAYSWLQKAVEQGNPDAQEAISKFF